MIYSFARVSAVLGMRRGDYYRQGSRGWLRLHESGGGGTTSQSVDRARERLTGRPLTRRVVLAMIKGPSAAARLSPTTCCHTFRATGAHGIWGTLEHAQQIAGRRDPDACQVKKRNPERTILEWRDEGRKG